MAAFELQESNLVTPEPLTAPAGPPVLGYDSRRVKDECIVAYKVYDSCRRQNCLTPKELGPARIVRGCVVGETAFQEGDVIESPKLAATVTMDKVEIKKIQVVDKQPSPFRPGYWDIDIKYVFEYRLTFRDACGDVIDKANANSIFNMKSTLFGSTGDDLVVGTDLYQGSGGSTFTAAPFIWAEAKAVGLDAKLHRSGHHTEVLVTIGLFSILKLFRLVHLNVQSKGFCIPDECQDQSDINPCEYFAELDFPIDIFAPPQRKEFIAGVSENIAKVKL